MLHLDGTGCGGGMERPVGLDARVARAGDGKIRCVLGDNERLHVGEFEIGCVKVRMQHGIAVKCRLAARRCVKGTAQHDARRATLELRMLDGDLRRRIQARSRDGVEAHDLRHAGVTGRQFDCKLRGLHGACDVRPGQ